MRKQINSISFLAFLMTKVFRISPSTLLLIAVKRLRQLKTSQQTGKPIKDGKEESPRPEVSLTTVLNIAKFLQQTALSRENPAWQQTLNAHVNTKTRQLSSLLNEESVRLTGNSMQASHLPESEFRESTTKK